MPEISVIIPCYNVEKYLAECLDSVLGQSFEDFEAICVNDGSTDKTGDILAQYANKDKRIKVITQENQGQAVARNVGLAVVAGSWISFIDGDDTIEVDFLSDLYASAHSVDADVVMTRTRYERNGDYRYDNFCEGECGHFVDRIKALPHGGAWNKLYKASLLKEYGIQFPAGVYWEDNVFTIKVCYWAQKMLIINGSCYQYRLNQSSTTKNVSNAHKRMCDSLSVAKEIRDFAVAQNLGAGDKGVLFDFCIDEFITAKNLMDDGYYTSVASIFGERKKLKRKRFKAIKKFYVLKIKNFVKINVHRLFIKNEEVKNA